MRRFIVGFKAAEIENGIIQQEFYYQKHCMIEQVIEVVDDVIDLIWRHGAVCWVECSKKI